MAIKQGKTKRLSIDEVIPYWRNPRRVTGEAVQALSQSITEFGYQQPIVVDEDMVIIIGHTRYTALRRLGVTEVDVLVADWLSDPQVKQLRVIDNRVAEYTSWDLDVLVRELEDADSELMKALFSDIVLGDDAQGDKNYVVDNRDFSQEWEDVDDKVEFVCPSCFHDWETVVTRDDILKGRIDNGTA
jgi:site-specific DNA-methyltransferase (adenine-specific)